MTLVQDWRRAFGQGDFPFYWVQLANYGNAVKNGHWMRVQEGQVKATALEIRESRSSTTSATPPIFIRRTNRMSAGGWPCLRRTRERPLYRQFTREADGIRIWFDNAGKSLKARANGPLTGFQIAGTDGKYMRRPRPASRTRPCSSPARTCPIPTRSVTRGLLPRREPDERRRAAGIGLPYGRRGRAGVPIARAGGSLYRSTQYRSTVTATRSMVLPLPGRPVPRTLILDAAGGASHRRASAGSC